MKHILVPLDFSQLSINGLEVAIKVARQLQADLILYHAVSSLSSGGFSASGGGSAGVGADDRFVAELYRQSLRSMDKVINHYLKEGVKMHPVLSVTDFKAGISDYVAKHKVDMIIMGTSGVSTLSEYFEGNHTEQVLRSVQCPVIALKEPQKDFTLRNIVISTDTSIPSDNYISFLKEMISASDVKVHLVKMVNSDKEVAGGKEEVRLWAEQHGLSNYSLYCFNFLNKEADLLNFATKHNADLIAVMVKRKKSWLPKMGTISMSEELIRKSALPVLSLDRKGD